MQTANLCLMCKGGRALCGHSPCPLLPRFRIAPEIEKKMSTEFFGPNYSVFIGRQGMPDVQMGPLTAVEERPGLDSPESWHNMGYGEIIKLRSLLVRSKQRESIFSKSRFVEELQELALASKPTDLELSFKKKPVYNMSFSDVSQPMGPSASLRRMRIAENPAVSQGTEKIARDDIKAAEASWLLHKKGLDISRITTILSSGILGMEKSRKIVPTRWSITAMDDLLAKRMMEKVREHREVGKYMVFEAQYLDNHFVILLMPGSWEFENFEAWAPGTTWSQGAKETQVVEEYEPFKGRTRYADKQAGGYYAARYSVARALYSMKRQARVVSFREIHEGYVVPLGVFVVRLAAKKALENRPATFSTRKEALDHIGTRLRLPIEEYVRRSKILKQRNLSDFIGTKSGSG